MSKSERPCATEFAMAAWAGMAVGRFSPRGSSGMGLPLLPTARIWSKRGVPAADARSSRRPRR